MVSDIEKRTELTRSQAIKIGAKIGNITIGSPADLEIVSVRLARGGAAVPPHARENPGVCFALCMQALEWGMPIMSVINKSYVVRNRGIDRIAYESQLIHAVIERNAPLKGRLRHEIIGEGDDRRCKVWGTFKGETKPHEYTSEALSKLREARGRNPDKDDVLKGSPLWEHQPEVQLFYSASRTWARLFAPDVILGAYTPEDPMYDEPKDITPASINGLAQRLRDAKKARVDDRGFDAAHVARVVGASIIEGEVKEAKNENDTSTRGDENGDAARTVGSDDRESRDQNQKTVPRNVEAAKIVSKNAPRERTAHAQKQGQEKEPGLPFDPEPRSKRSPQAPKAKR
jgi:hypothetical protein